MLKDLQIDSKLKKYFHFLKSLIFTFSTLIDNNLMEHLKEHPRAYFYVLLIFMMYVFSKKYIVQKFQTNALFANTECVQAHILI